MNTKVCNTICGKFDYPRYIRFRKHYRRALEAGVDVFIFDHETVTVGFAKYLLEYLDQQFVAEPTNH